MKLSDNLEVLTGIGPKTAKLYQNLKLETVEDLIHHYPRRYDDFSKIELIGEITPGPVTIKAQLITIEGRWGFRRIHITTAIVSDQTGSVAVIWYNQPFRIRYLKRGEIYYLSGEYKFSRGRLILSNPTIELVTPNPTQTARIRPVYPTTKGLSNSQIRQALQQVRPLIQSLPDTFPSWIQADKDVNLKPLSQTIELIHFPNKTNEIEPAQKEIGLRELFAASLAGQLLKFERKKLKRKKIPVNEEVQAQAIDSLGFKLTVDQQKTIDQILSLLATKPEVLNGLIQGDVASGKTIVVGLIALNIISNGGQVILMSPTSILAQQHFKTIQELFGSINWDLGQIALLTSSSKVAERRKLKEGLAEGKVKLVVGTQALLFDDYSFSQLDLVVIDEQHRFGVEQRQFLQRNNQSPHSLTLSATPIPRSLALVLYGELDVYRLQSKPAGFGKIETKIIKLNQRLQLFDEVLKRATNGRQVYIICPAIDSTEIDDSIQATVKQVAKIVNKNHFRCLHSRLASDEKNKIMTDFINRKFSILISTSVVEAGIDVSTVETMIILSPDRFGLAQLHQLRGRIGRRAKTNPAICYLCLNDEKPPSERIKALAKSNDGFALSEIDLKLRGPGSIYGTQQWGKLDFSLPFLIDPSRVDQARKLAVEFIKKKEKLDKYPKLKSRVKYYQQLTKLN